WGCLASGARKYGRTLLVMGWGAVPAHLVVCVLLSVILVEVMLWEWQKVPFVCSYLPGKKNVSVLFVAYWMAFATWERCLCGMRTSRNRWWPPSASSGGNLSRQPVASLSSIS
ncbi:MAG TPA: hypothetical protein VM120_20700, partial [Bryobacteraceae bacterium]|nr:hypothetical protein [Bryobacteraceae bacterium]